MYGAWRSKSDANRSGSARDASITAASSRASRFMRRLVVSSALLVNGFTCYPQEPPREFTVLSSRKGSAAGQQAPLEPGRHRGGAVVDAQLGVDVQHVGLDRGLADEQAGGRLAVRA